MQFAAIADRAPEQNCRYYHSGSVAKQISQSLGIETQLYVGQYPSPAGRKPPQPDIPFGHGKLCDVMYHAKVPFDAVLKVREVITQGDAADAHPVCSHDRQRAGGVFIIDTPAAPVRLSVLHSDPTPPTSPSRLTPCAAVAYTCAASVFMRDVTRTSGRLRHMCSTSSTPPHLPTHFISHRACPITQEAALRGMLMIW